MQMSFLQQGNQHLDYEKKHLSYQSSTEGGSCEYCVELHGMNPNSHSPGSSSKSDSESEVSPFKPRRRRLKKLPPIDHPYKGIEKNNSNKWCDNWKEDEAHNPSQLDNEESVAIVCGKVNGIITTMLLDTGSSISAITENFAQQLHLETWYTDDVLVVTLANTHVERYPERMCVVTFEIGDLEISEELNVLPGQIYNITLGKNWLKSHMAICDYGLDILRLPGSRPIRMGIPAPIAPFKSIVKPKTKNSRKQSLQQVQLQTYPSLRTLLFLGGWLPFMSSKQANKSM